MSTLLYITAHPLEQEQSNCLAMGEKFLEAHQLFHPEDTLVRLNLFQTGVPAINRDIFAAWGKLRKGAALTELTEQEQLIAGRHGELSNQFVAADKYVFVNPMWNHFVPAELKAYLDTLCVAGKTFRYTASGPVGLLAGKKVLHIQSAGGIYDRNSPQIKDFGHAYLEHIMHFFGITDMEGLFIEGGDANPAEAAGIKEQAIARALILAEQF